MPRRDRLQNMLFVGRRNDALTQMAEGFAKTLLEPVGVVVRSAGLTPTRVNPWAIRVMAEEGIDITPQESKSLDSIVASTVGKMILVEHELAIPRRFHRIRRVEWKIDDPTDGQTSADDLLRSFRRVRDDIEALVLRLVALRAIRALRSSN